jgi:hypothetical protein
MKEDILAGLKNALERGSSLEVAAQSFINAGYNPVDVKEAASVISSGASNLVSSISPSRNESVVSKSKSSLTLPTQNQIMNNPYIQSNKPKKNTTLIIMLVLILLMLVGSIILLLLYKDNVVEYIKTLTS